MDIPARSHHDTNNLIIILNEYLVLKSFACATVQFMAKPVLNTTPIIAIIQNHPLTSTGLRYIRAGRIPVMSSDDGNDPGPHIGSC